MNFRESEAFKKEFAKLSKKYKSLPEDIERVKRIISKYPSGEDSRHAIVLKGSVDAQMFIVKRRMVCRATKGSNFRLIYFFDGEKVEILFIEIYFKGKKANEDTKRIDTIWSELIG